MAQKRCHLRNRRRRRGRHRRRRVRDLGEYAPRLDWRPAQWLPAYLVGLGLISWQGGFGDGVGRIPMWWDMALVAAFALGIYAWAIRVALPADAIEQNIEDVEVVDEGGH